jgi:hypothetical protein
LYSTLATRRFFYSVLNSSIVAAHCSTAA